MQKSLGFTVPWAEAEIRECECAQSHFSVVCMCMHVLCHTNAQGGQSLPMKRFIDPRLKSCTELEELPTRLNNHIHLHDNKYYISRITKNMQLIKSR